MDRDRGRPAAGGEEGMALITVMLTIVIISVLALTTINYSTRSLTQSRRSQDGNAALPAAEAGIDDYITRLNNDGNLAAVPDLTNPAMSGYVPIPGGASEGTFKYTVDHSTVGTDGRIRITSTGKVGKVTRTVKADLRRSGFIEFLYFTDFETIDPASNSSIPASCANYDWNRSSSCSRIMFAENDVIDGPIHSNDTMYMTPGSNGPTFNGRYSTSWQDPDKKYWKRSNTGTSTPKFLGGAPRWDVARSMPPSNLQLAEDARSNGCLFTGPTRITLRSDGKLDVVSPMSKNTNPFGGSGCSKSSLTASGTHTIDIPPNKVIHVQPVPTSTSDPNHGTYGTTERQCTWWSCKDVFVEQHPLGYPIANDITDYEKKAGDLFVQGTLKGQLTLSAGNDIVITGDTLVQDRYGSDMLGLVGHNYVWVYHPVSSGGSNLQSGNENRTIHAAILALNHSFAVQNHDKGPVRDDLTVYGSIAQKFRGPVGTSAPRGYTKKYSYDDRLQFVSPPKFLEPVDAPWQVVRWEESEKPAAH